MAGGEKKNKKSSATPKPLEDLQGLSTSRGGDMGVSPSALPELDVFLFHHVFFAFVFCDLRSDERLPPSRRISVAPARLGWGLCL